MLGTLRWGTVLAGVGAGGVTATLSGLLVWPLLELLGVEGAPLAAITVGTLVGLGFAGWVAGRLALHSPRFHGSVAALGFAGVVLVVARLGGSPAPLLQVLILCLLAVVVGGAAGTWAGRRKAGPGPAGPA
ncbi:MAG TPA: hypothetical protein VID03_06505 [Acidimicrobiia bacterium]